MYNKYLEFLLENVGITLDDIPTLSSVKSKQQPVKTKRF